MFDCRRLDNLTIQKVIVIEVRRGEGTDEDMWRIVTQYCMIWDIPASSI